MLILLYFHSTIFFRHDLSFSFLLAPRVTDDWRSPCGRAVKKARGSRTARARFVLDSIRAQLELQTNRARACTKARELCRAELELPTSLVIYDFCCYLINQEIKYVICMSYIDIIYLFYSFFLFY